MQIAFWSPNHGQTATTTSAIAMATSIAIRYPFKVLIGHSHFERSTLERCLLKTNRFEDEIDFSDKGIGALKRLAKNGRLIPEMVKDYTTSLLANSRLDLLEGIQERDLVDAEEDIEVLSHIFDSASKTYDLVIIDVHSGMNQEMTRKILSHVDLVVVCLNQNVWLIEDYFADSETIKILENNEVMFHIGLYNPMGKYTLRNLEKLYGLTPIIGTPYNIDFMDACNGGNALDYILRTMSLKKIDRQFEFAKQLGESGEKLMDYIQTLYQKEYP